MAEKDAVSVEPPANNNHGEQHEVQLEKRKWYRTTLFNAFVIGGAGFLAPGLWNAMNSLGAAGAEQPFLINAANALVFALMGFLCLFGGPIANRIGLRWTLVLSTLGYPIYSLTASAISAGLYTNNRFGNVWFVLLGSVACGISYVLSFLSQSSIWLWFRTGGPLVGGAILLALNHSPAAKKKGSVGWHVLISADAETYLVFVFLQVLAAPLAFALTSPEKVQRSDGSKVIVKAEKSLLAEMRALWQASTKKEIALLLPVFWASYFNQYSGNFETYYFGLRARALIGFVTNFATLLSSWLISLFLDYQRLTVKKRLVYSFFYVVFLHLVAWIYGWVIQEKYTANPPVLDWSDKGFTEGFFVLLLWEFSRQSLQNWIYYLVSTLTDNISELSRFTGILRGQESFAQAVSFGLNTRNWYGGRVPLAVNTILLGLAVYPTWLVVKDLKPDATRIDPAAVYSQENDELNLAEKAVITDAKGVAK
ncbi:hypothetical protein T310_5768 [Rasamsonia emersonii CBS 393.64]|uniref:DUF895 domain membrane protein n=1 Tax=Rasamsonia emersonii (strain ATCC 16479 / CBS 393.64 / IMI 116815) TaxID=1408163 RepID=A0A0F4YPN8_RASE3|nr:hypothetical protein T310_5768 [Rasamsonia emersonii CBS 393.64]KKA20199.1 hypothetical protein T310_5768 [Rasamsonia emersonii CBS 393.64]